MKDKYNVEREEAEKLVVNFIQVIEDASSYLFSKNHSDPYTEIGYICAWLRYHYPLEFLATALNINVGKDEKTAKITEYVNKVGINILPPKFGYSKGSYFIDKESNSIYKGIGSIKFLNSQIGDDLYNLSKDKTYNSFIDLLVELDSININSKQLQILIKLNYFSDFGGSKTLLHIYNLYIKLYSKKQFKKEGMDENTLLLFKKYAQKETEKMFKDVDVKSLIDEILKNVPNEDISIKDLLTTQSEYLGYITYIDKSYKSDVAIISNIKINGYGTPFLTLYRVCDGKTTTIKCDKKYYNENPLGQFELIKMNNITKRNKRKKVDGKWIVSDEVEFILNNYSRVI